MRKRQPLPKPGSLRYVWALKNVWHFLRSFSKARKAIAQHLTRKEKFRKTIVARAHHRPSSSHVLPFPDAMDALAGDVHDSLFYYDCTWNSVFPSAAHSDMIGTVASADEDEAVILAAATAPAGKMAANGGDVSVNEIDRLADVFIAGFHEKFRLEKQESYRRFHEMLARGV